MEVRVYANFETFSQNKPLFARSVVCNDSIEIPFALLLRALRFLFGSNCIVVFVNTAL